MKTRADAAAAKQKNAFKPSAAFKAAKGWRLRKKDLGYGRYVEETREKSLTNLRDLRDALIRVCETLDHTPAVRARLEKLRLSYEKSLGIRTNTTKNGRRAIAFLD